MRALGSLGRNLRVLDKPATGKLPDVRNETSHLRNRCRDSVVCQYNAFLLVQDLFHGVLDPASFISGVPVQRVNVPKD